MVFPADAVAGWECVRGPDAVPSAEYCYDLNPDVDVEEAMEECERDTGDGIDDDDALEQCERDLHAWFAALREHGRYDVQIGVRYENKEDGSTCYNESEPFIVRVPLTAVDRQTLGGDARG